MPFNSIGDLASGLITRHSQIAAQKNLQKYAIDLTTGMASNIGEALRNDMSQPVYWQRDLAENRTLAKTLTESLTKIQAKGLALTALNEAISSVTIDVTTTLASNSEVVMDVASKNASYKLDQVLSQLNTQVSGQTIFSGSSTEKNAMASSSNILQSVKSYIGPIDTTLEVITKVSKWMQHQTNEFAEVAFTGGENDLSPIRLSSNRTITDSIRANDPAIKMAIENLILATLASDEDLALNNASKATLLDEAANGLRGAHSKIINLEAGNGYIENELEKARTRVTSEISTTEQIRAETIGIDEFETARKLQETELQLEKIYAVTAKLSRMTLLEYLR